MTDPYYRVHRELGTKVNLRYGKKSVEIHTRTVMAADQLREELKEMLLEVEDVRSKAQELLRSMGEYPEGGKYWDVDAENELQKLVLSCRTCGEFEYYWKHMDQYRNLGVWHEFRI